MIETLADGVLARGGFDMLSPQKAHEEDAGTTAKPATSLIQTLGGSMTSSGVRVSADGAMRASAVNACVRAYAETVATLPLSILRRSEDRRTRDVNHPLYRILHDQPNPWMTSFEWRELMERHRCLRGNAFSLIERNGRGDVTALYPLNPDRVIVEKGEDRLPYYRVQELAGHPVLSRERVFHLRNMTKDGYCGLGYIAENMEAVGLSIALEQFGASLFGNGALMRGFFKYGGTLTPEQLKTVRESVRERYSGLRNSNIPGVLDGDWSWNATSMKAEEAQFLESRNYQVEDIARIFRMQAVMIGHPDKTATYASAEQFFLAFIKFTALPVLTRWEQALSRDLLTGNELDRYFKFNTSALERADIKSRYVAYAVSRQWGFSNVDEIREMEDWDPLPDGRGQIYLQPMNMVEAGTQPDQNGKAVASIDAIGKILREAAPSLAALDQEEQEEELANA